MRSPSERVIAADLTAMKIPRHVLYSPEGQVLFEQTGTMTALEIRGVIDERSSAWRDWSDYGARADWMRVE